MDIQIQPYKTSPWFKLWWDVWTLPGTDTFRMLLEEGNGGAARGFLWIILSSALTALVYAGVSYLYPGVNTQLASLPPASRQMVQSVGALGNLLCIPFSSVIGVAVTAGIYHGLSRLLGGSGEWGRLVFCIAAIEGPVVLIGVLTSLPVSLMASTRSTWLIPVAIFSVLFSLVLSVYSTAQFVFALKAVENMGTGRSLLVVLLPGLISIAIFGCLFGGAIATYMSRLPLK